MAIAVSTNSTVSSRQLVSFAGVAISTPSVVDIVEATTIIKDPFITTVPDQSKFAETENAYVGEVIIQYRSSRDLWSTG